MTEQTHNLNLPLIAAAQAQKHVTHNEALLALDSLTQASVIQSDLGQPPASANAGDSYIVASTASGDWANMAGKIAVADHGGWRFFTPRHGWRVWHQADAALYVFNGTEWQIYNAGLNSDDLAVGEADALGVNTTADSTNRLAVKTDAALFSHDDITPGTGDVQAKLNKKTTTNTASVLFQNNWQGQAEFGLTGDDDFHIKVSDNGSNWFDAMAVENDTGIADFPNGIRLGGDDHLDHYQAGNFTPTISAGQAGDLTVSYGTNSGYYTRIGELCFFNIQFNNVTLTYQTASGNLRILGLPFSSNANTINTINMRSKDADIVFPDNATAMSATFIPGTSKIQFYGHSSTNSSTTLKIDDIASGSSFRIHLSGFYWI